MKKRPLKFLGVFCLTLLPLLVSAQGSKPFPCTGFADCDWDALVELGNNVLQWFVFISVPIATLVIVYAGIQMVLTPTNPEKHKEATKILWSAVLGLVLILGAWVIIHSLLVFLDRGDIL